MKQLYLSLIVFFVLSGCALTVPAQSGRVKSQIGTPSDTGPFSDPIKQPPEQKIPKQETKTLRPGSVKMDLPEQVNGERIYRGWEVESKAIVKKKPAAVFVQEARKRGIEGTVILRVIFGANGEIKNLTVESGLPYGLTESAIKAAHKIKFQPAMKDGKSVSMWALLEYQFSLY
jgi:TonB family protein